MNYTLAIEQIEINIYLNNTKVETLFEEEEEEGVSNLYGKVIRCSCVA